MAKPKSSSHGSPHGSPGSPWLDDLEAPSHPEMAVAAVAAVAPRSSKVPLPKALARLYKDLTWALSCWSIWWSPSPYGFLSQLGIPNSWMVTGKSEYRMDYWRWGGTPMTWETSQSRSRSMWQNPKVSDFNLEFLIHVWSIPQGINPRWALETSVHLCCFLHWGSAPWRTTTTRSVSMFRWMAVSYRIGILTTDWGPGFLSP